MFCAGPSPIHHALRTNASLGVVKLLTDKYPGQELIAVDGSIPLHLACESGKEVGFVKHFLRANGNSISVLDGKGNSPLHLACCKGKSESVNALLEESELSVSDQNDNGKLPIELLVEADTEKDSVDYIEAIWRLLVASPETVKMFCSADNSTANSSQVQENDSTSIRNSRKRTRVAMVSRGYTIWP